MAYSKEMEIKARGGDVPAICETVRGILYDKKVWTEDFVDDESGEHLPIERQQVVDRVLSDQDKQVLADLKAYVNSRLSLMSDEQLQVIYNDDDYPEKFPVRDELVKRNNPDALADLAHAYYRGEECNGIFRSRKQARILYAQAIAAGYIPKYEGETDITRPYIDTRDSYPSTAKYCLKGLEGSLMTFENLLKAAEETMVTHKTRETVVYLSRIMDDLVGSSEYDGWIRMFYWTNLDSSMAIEAEFDEEDVEPFAYAIRKAFPGIEVSIDN